MFATELAKPSSLSLGAIDESGTLVGYLVLSRYVDAWHVMNVAVAPERRRAGIASALLRQLLDETRGGDARRGYTLEVRVSNHKAIALYERLGFVHEGTHREFLERDGQRHDMLLYGMLRPEWEARR